MKKIMNIKSQKEKLLESISLPNIKLSLLEETAISFKELSDFISVSWSDTYSNRDRFNYSSEYLEWVFSLNSGGLFSVIASDEKGLAGVFLHTPRKVFYRGNQISTGIQSALSVRPDLKGKGLAKLLHLSAQEKCCSFTDSLFLWYDSTVKKNNTSHNIFQRFDGNYMDFWGKFVLKAKLANKERVFDTLRLSRFEKILMTLLSSKSKSGDTSTSVTNLTESDIDECSEFINTISKEKYGRVFEPAELKRYALYKKNNFYPLAGMLKQNGQMRGIAIGYPIQVVGERKKDTVFFMDSIYLRPDTVYSERMSFLRGFEKLAVDHFNPMAFVGIDPNLRFTEGYLPTSDSLSLYSLPFEKKASKEDSKKICILDHK
jgi:hypothetical protein